MDHSELIKAEASKLAELHFCPEIKANLARKEANAGRGALYGGLAGAGLGALTGGAHGYLKDRGSMKDALKQSLLGALLGGGVGAAGGGLWGAGSDALDKFVEQVEKDRPSDVPTVDGPDPNSWKAQYPHLAGAYNSAQGEVIRSVAGGIAGGGVGGTLGAGIANMELDRPNTGKALSRAIAKSKLIHDTSRNSAVPISWSRNPVKGYADLSKRQAQSIDKVKELLRDNLNDKAKNAIPKGLNEADLAKHLVGEKVDPLTVKGKRVDPTNDLKRWASNNMNTDNTRLSPRSAVHQPLTRGQRLSRVGKGFSRGGRAGLIPGMLAPTILDYLKADQVPRR